MNKKDEQTQIIHIIHIHIYKALKSTSESKAHYLLSYLLRSWTPWSPHGTRLQYFTAHMDPLPYYILHCVLALTSVTDITDAHYTELDRR